mmetsp:Transcript_68269/g.120806  ORF Transcript_68269/g.120806 Transcript_68269/m.120806 type:complete len:801 (-) Transcript_68269:289-2691(-)
MPVNKPELVCSTTSVEPLLEQSCQLSDVYEQLSESIAWFQNAQEGGTREWRSFLYGSGVVFDRMAEAQKKHQEIGLRATTPDVPLWEIGNELLLLQKRKRTIKVNAPSAGNERRTAAEAIRMSHELSRTLESELASTSSSLQSSQGSVQSKDRGEHRSRPRHAAKNSRERHMRLFTQQRQHRRAIESMPIFSEHHSSRRTPSIPTRYYAPDKRRPSAELKGPKWSDSAKAEAEKEKLATSLSDSLTRKDLSTSLINSTPEDLLSATAPATPTLEMLQNLLEDSNKFPRIAAQLSKLATQKLKGRELVYQRARAYQAILTKVQDIVSQDNPEFFAATNDTSEQVEEHREAGQFSSETAPGTIDTRRKLQNAPLPTTFLTAHQGDSIVADTHTPTFVPTPHDPDIREISRPAELDFVLEMINQFNPHKVRKTATGRPLGTRPTPEEILEAGRTLPHGFTRRDPRSDEDQWLLESVMMENMRLASQSRAQTPAALFEGQLRASSPSTPTKRNPLLKIGSASFKQSPAQQQPRIRGGFALADDGIGIVPVSFNVEGSDVQSSDSEEAIDDKDATTQRHLMQRRPMTVPQLDPKLQRRISSSTAKPGQRQLKRCSSGESLYGSGSFHRRSGSNHSSPKTGSPTARQDVTSTFASNDDRLMLKKVPGYSPNCMSPFGGDLNLRAVVASDVPRTAVGLAFKARVKTPGLPGSSGKDKEKRSSTAPAGPTCSINRRFQPPSERPWSLRSERSADLDSAGQFDVLRWAGNVTTAKRGKSFQGHKPGHILHKATHPEAAEIFDDDDTVDA